MILTTGANASMEPIHDRMPLILEKEEAVDWLLEGTKAGEMLRRTSPRLERKTEYEQLSLFSS